jgi:serine/threonine-protein kinase
MSDLPEALKAALADRYDLIREVGEGGMATVYLAEDLKHRRKVALKVMKPELAAVVGADRFLTEIETTANLQHPNILPLFDSGETEGFLFYVMPFVEGETLRDRLDREKQLPISDAIRIAIDLAEALDYAHRQGVIHRDMKPANVLLHEGRPLIADFGIALAVGAAGGARLTETGLSVGTPYYMSPEQATGDQAVGPASDTYALGCVLYEMLIGEPPYLGNTAQAVLGKIIAGAPVSATAQRSSIPGNVEAAIRCALEKLPADRFADAHAFAEALKNPSFRHGGAESVEAAVGSAGPWKPAAIALGIAFLATAGYAVLSRPAPDESKGVLRYVLEVPLEQGQQGDFGSAVTISPDGQRIAYLGQERDDQSPRIWIRERSRLEAQPVPGTEGVYQLFFSPDGSRIGFITEDRDLKVVSLGGEPPVTLAEGMRRGGGAWSDDGFIYYAEGDDDDAPAGLRRIPETGGPVEVVTTVDTTRNEVRHYFPDVLPGSRIVLFSIARNAQYDAGQREVAALDVETGDVHVLLSGVVGRWADSGHILAVRADGAMLAAPFDEGTLEAGPAVPLMEGVQVEIQASVDWDVSRDGTLVYAPGVILDRTSNQPVWVDRSGIATPIDPEWRGDYAAPRLSPDGRFLALDRQDGQDIQVWVKELDTGPEAKLTFQGPANTRPSWTPDGRSIGFTSLVGGIRQINVRRADAAVAAEALVVPEAGEIAQLEFSADGEWVVFRIGGDLYARRYGEAEEVLPLLADPAFAEVNPALSPDGRWIAFNANESGGHQVYVRPFPNVEDGKWLVSTDGGVSPRWGPDGMELFYRAPSGDFVAVEVLPGANFVVGERRVLFDHSPFMANVAHTQYDVHPDGDRFAMIQRAANDDGAQLLVVENFFEEIAARAGQ